MRGMLDCRLMAAVLAVSLVGVAAIAAEPAPAPGTPAAAPAKTNVAPAAAAPESTDPLDAIKQPTDWLKLGADLRLRQEYLDDATTMSDEVKNHEQDYSRFRARAWATITPADNLTINNRWTWEGRYWLQPEAAEGWQTSYIICDQLNLQVKNLFDSKSTLTVGRQDIIMNEGWLVLDGTPLDGSRTIFFDAIRLQMQLPDKKSSLDMSVLQTHQDPEAWFPAIGNTATYPNGHGEPSLVEQNEFGVIADYKYTVDKGTNFDAFYIYKNNDQELANGDQGEIHALGGRAEHAFNDNLSARAQGVYEFGNDRTPYTTPGRLNAWGATSRVTYAFKDTWDQKLGFDLEYLSGDDPGSQTNEGFDPLWGRWPQWSEMYANTWATETHGRPGEQTNLIRVGPNWEANPTKQLNLSAAYYALFAPEDANSGITADGNFRGNYFQAVAKYKFNSHLTGHLWGEYFFPGNFYSDSNQSEAVFLRVELNLTL